MLYLNRLLSSEEQVRENSNTFVPARRTLEVHRRREDLKPENNVTILVVDDAPDAREYLRIWLQEEAGYEEAIFLSSALEAEGKMAEISSCSVAVLDGLNWQGRKLAQRLKAANPDMRIIGYSNTPEVFKGEESVDMVVPKWAPQEDLLAAIAKPTV